MDINYYNLKAPTRIVTTQLGIPQKYKQQCIEEVYRLGDSMNQQTNVKAIMSSFHVFKQTNIFDNLISQILKTVEKIFPTTEQYDYKLRDCWTNIYKKGNYTVPHTHASCDISFVYYLQSSASTPLIFDDCDFLINPVDDTLAIFPGYLFHSVPKHEDEQDRVCMAGNLNIHIK